MAKITLSTLLGDFASIAKLNANFSAIQEAFENTLSRDGSTPNEMEADLDLNGRRIINLAAPTDNTDAVTLEYLNSRSPLESYVGSYTQGFTATAGQTLFTLSQAYVPGATNILVFLNGVKLRLGTDYAETSTTSFTLAEGAEAGDTVEAIINQVTADATVIPATQVTFGGTGLTSRTAQDKLADTVAAEDYGATADGVTDNLAAVTAALAALSAAGGGTLQFGAGTYVISAAVTVPSNVTIRGAGRNATTLYFGATGFQGANKQHVAIRDMTIDGGSVATTYGLYFEDCPRGLVLDNLYITSFGTASTGAGIYLGTTGANDMWGSRITNTVVEDCGRGIVINGAADLKIDAICRLNRGHNLYINNASCVELNGVYENPSGSSGSQYNVYITSSKRISSSRLWMENAVTENLKLTTVADSDFRGLLLQNITSAGPNNNSLTGCTNVRLQGTVSNVDASEIGIAIDSTSSDVDYTAVAFTSMHATATNTSDASTNVSTVPLTNGFTFPVSAVPTKKLYYASATGAIASDAATAFVDGVDGQIVEVMNISANAITFKHNANLKCRGATDRILGQHDSIVVRYVKPLAYWVEVGGVDA